MIINIIYKVRVSALD